MIDLICAFVDQSDDNWKNEYKKYFDADNLQRYRDYGTFRFLIRSIFFNCLFINNVFVVVQQESQIPKWLNVKHPRIKIVFHKDYIPSELLPTFNTNVIQNFYHNIPELSDKFILANDDMIFLKPNKEEEWFIGNHPQQFIVKDENYKKNPGIFGNILFNNIFDSNTICNTEKLLVFKNNHLPISYIKPLWKEVWDNNFDLLYNSLTIDKGRSAKQFSDWLFNYIQIIRGITQHNENCEHSGYILLKDNLDIEKLDTILTKSKVACFNDGIKANTEIFDILISKLLKILPYKSDFEI